MRAWPNHVKHTEAVTVPVIILHADFAYLLLYNTGASDVKLR